MASGGVVVPQGTVSNRPAGWGACVSWPRTWAPTEGPSLVDGGRHVCRPYMYPTTLPSQRGGLMVPWGTVSNRHTGGGVVRCRGGIHAARRPMATVTRTTNLLSFTPQQHGRARTGSAWAPSPGAGHPVWRRGTLPRARPREASVAHRRTPAIRHTPKVRVHLPVRHARTHLQGHEE